MKHAWSILINLLLVVCMVSGCNGNSGKSVSMDKELEELDAKCEQILNDTSLTEQQQTELVSKLLRSTYNSHPTDSLGLSAFIYLITNFCEPEEAITMYDQANEFIRGDKLATSKILAKKNFKKVQAGSKFIEVSGPNALTGEKLSISDRLGGNKPVLLDFWASWCSPCRNEIKNALLDIAATGKVDILGIAVWEDSLDDTVKAIKELGITWPVIYSGGREGSPSIEYGVSGIPTLILLDSDGTILARGNAAEELGLLETL